MKAIFYTLDTAICQLTTLALALAALCMLAIMVIGSIDTLSMNLLNAPLPAALEGSEVLLGILIFSTFAYTQRQRGHIKVDLFVAKAPPILRRLSLLLTLLIGAALFAVLAWRSWDLAMSSLQIDEHANAIFTFPIYPAKFLIAGGLGVAELEFLRQLVWFFVDSNEYERISTPEKN